MERLWTRSFIFAILGTLFLFVAFYALYPTLPVFIKQMGGSEAQVGLAMGFFMLASVAIRPLTGGLLDRFGRRPFIVGGILLFALAMYLYGWVGGVGVLLGIRILHGVSWAVSSTSLQTAITDMIPRPRLGEGMGWMGLVMTLAMAVGPVFGVWLFQEISPWALFLSGVGLSMVALLLTFGAAMPFQRQPGSRGIGVVEKSVLPLTLAVFFLFGSYGGITTFVPLFADAIGVNSGTFFLAFALTLALTRPSAGSLSDRYGEGVVIVPALLFAMVALVVLGFSTGLAGVVGAAVLYGIGFGAAHPVLNALTVRMARPDRRGVAIASFSTAVDLGIGLGAIGLGWISEYVGYQGLFTAAAGLVVCSLLVFLWVKRSLAARSLPLPAGEAT
ncbi:MAG: MFS transporter [Litorilinea sp.]|nr:MAG: MFS transporter [Litorilinea sp.]